MRRIVAYVVLAYAFSWAWWVPLALTGQVTRAGQGWPTHLPGLMGPALAAVVVTAATTGRTGLKDLWSRVVRWRVPMIWYAILGVTAAMLLIPFAVWLVTGEAVTTADFRTYSGAPLLAAPLLVPFVLLVNGFGEETGWRGFLADELLRRTSRGVTALVVWVVWAGWHLPMFWVVANFRDFGVGGTIGWLVGIAFGSLWLTWMYDCASHSIFLVALWHTVYNFATATDATSGLPAAVASTLVMVAAGVVACLPRTWRSPDAKDRSLSPA